MSHRARRSRAEAPDEAVELAAGEVRRAFEEWASRFVALVVRDLAPAVASQRQDATAVSSETNGANGSCLVWRTDATVEGLYREVGRARPRAEKLEQAFRLLDKQSADELRVAGVATADVIPKAQARKQEWLRANTDLIRAEADLRRRVERIISDPLNQGRSVKDIAKLLEEQAGYSTSRATLTARDQTLKLYGQIQQERQQNAGVERYVWTTSLDERVRPDHADLDGTIQRWDDPPIVDQRTGRRGHPGSGDFQCRCTAVAILDDEPAEGEAPAEQQRQVSLRERAVAEGRAAPPRPPREPAMRPTQAELDAARARAEAERRALAERERLEREADARIAAARQAQFTAVDVDRLSAPSAPQEQENVARATREFAKLPERQQAAVADYLSFEHDLFQAIQSGLTDAQISTRLGLTAEEVAAARGKLPTLLGALDDMAVARPTQRGPLYRGLALTESGFDDMVKRGTVDFTSATNSTSFNPSIAVDFAVEAPGIYSTPERQLTKRVVFRIADVDRGALAMHEGNVLAHQQEVLVGRTSFEIAGRTYDEARDVWVLDLRQAGTSSFRAEAARLPDSPPALAPLKAAELRARAESVEVLKGTKKRATAEIETAVESAIRGKSLRELGALDDPSSLRPESFTFLRADPFFRETGNLQDRFASQGGLPWFTIEADGRAYLNNGRHRVTVARELGLRQIVARMTRYNARGDVVWQYVGPVRV